MRMTHASYVSCGFSLISINVQLQYVIMHAHVHMCEYVHAYDMTIVQRQPPVSNASTNKLPISINTYIPTLYTVNQTCVHFPNYYVYTAIALSKLLPCSEIIAEITMIYGNNKITTIKR